MQVHNTLAEPIRATPAAAVTEGRLAPLSQARPGDRGVITEVRLQNTPGKPDAVAAELERRLLEFGFVEGARIELLHEGTVGHDPIAVRLDDMRVALRRRYAEDIWVLWDANSE